MAGLEGYIPEEIIKWINGTLPFKITVFYIEDSKVFGEITRRHDSLAGR